MTYDWPKHISASAKHVVLKLLDIEKRFTENIMKKSKARVIDFRKKIFSSLRAAVSVGPATYASIHP